MQYIILFVIRLSLPSCPSPRTHHITRKNHTHARTHEHISRVLTRLLSLTRASSRAHTHGRAAMDKWTVCLHLLRISYVLLWHTNYHYSVHVNGFWLAVCGNAGQWLIHWLMWMNAALTFQKATRILPSWCANEQAFSMHWVTHESSVLYTYMYDMSQSKLQIVSVFLFVNSFAL
jgi:hypothetical protein